MDYRELIRDTQVHGTLYTSPEVYADELERIWYSTWVFVGHASEVPEPNDYVRKKLGPQDVIMTRDSAGGEVHLLLNRCAHRGGNLVCDDKPATPPRSAAPTTAGRTGTTATCSATPTRTATAARTSFSSAWAGCPGSRSTGGASCSAASRGDPARGAPRRGQGEIDRLARLSPTGKVELTAGWLQHRTHANWKLLAENETDGYHPQFVHGSIFSVTGSPIGALYSEKSTAVTRAFGGGGHSENDLRPEFRRFAEPMRWFGTTADRTPEYVAAMKQAYGEEEANRIMIEGAPHVMIFPNLFIAEIQVFNIQPVGPGGECVQYSTAVQLEARPS